MIKTNRKRGAAYIALACAAGALAVSPAFAQKSKDTFRFAVSQPINSVDEILNPQPDTQIMTKSVFDRIIEYDDAARKYAPGLAESWKEIDAKTTEFKIREGIKFHDGSDFDADDFIYTLNYMINPDNKFRFKPQRIGWIDTVEKVDKYTVRVTAKGPTTIALARMGTGAIPMTPAGAYEAGSDPNDFGKAPIGTGPYKVVEVDVKNSIVRLEKYADYKHGSAAKPAGQVGKVEVRSIGDEQTQIARMLAGDQDLMYGAPRDAAAGLKANPKLTVSIQPTLSFSYLYFNTVGKGGFEILKDKRVREALSLAVDRKAMAKALLPTEAAEDALPASMCDPWAIGCDVSSKLPDYNPTRAKELLKEAGHENGFEIALTTWGEARESAEAVANYLREVGIKASVDAVTFGVYNKKRADGDVQSFVSYWDNGGAQSDVDTTANFFFQPGPINYHGDEELAQLIKQGAQTPDLEARKAIYRKVFNKANDEFYMFPLIKTPAIVVHTKELKLTGDHRTPQGFLMHQVAWN